MFMRFRRLICFVLGLWLGGGLLMAWLASSGFRQADRLLANPGPAASNQIRTLGYSSARALLRYQVAEQNRLAFATWETVQLAGGTLFFLYLLFGTTARKFGLGIVLAMILIVALQRFLLTPDLSAMERAIEISPEVVGRPRDAFWMIHSAYFSLEALKWGLALILAGKTVVLGRRRARGRSDDSGDDFDLIDKPDYGHVDR
jgi:hypothetical protein